eukprot:CAMPEP_0204371852 /NCGR_PEP_ID=MMETSP0469-20131031/46819_1 /ASSEMBLY_ACC=CAM_ASM_000384 /TAXON_ID=2969 /ORGANISM="Oxyrrhis marina" /LENGTH=52 /DNA_ID=CAMNT_0051362033 /DNA_START=240 /DNA_END=395 /DNA_ORIENTATION=-
MSRAASGVAGASGQRAGGVAQWVAWPERKGRWCSSPTGGWVEVWCTILCWAG